MTEINKRDELVERIQQARSEWLAFLQGLQVLDWEAPGFCGEWSLKDVTAHLTWHEQEMVTVLQLRALVGSPWWNLPLDERNDRIYNQLHERPVDEIRQEADQVHHNLLDALNSVSDDDLFDPTHFAEMPSEWRPIDVIASNTYEHYEDHLQNARKTLQS